jgi:hypothetical protein
MKLFICFYTLTISFVNIKIGTQQHILLDDSLTKQKISQETIKIIYFTSLRTLIFPFLFTFTAEKHFYF